MRVHKIANVGKALAFIQSKGVKLAGIGPEGESNEKCLFSLVMWIGLCYLNLSWSLLFATSHVPWVSLSSRGNCSSTLFTCCGSTVLFSLATCRNC